MPASPAPAQNPTRARPGRPLGLYALLGFTVVSVLGFATFGLHPELLARLPQVAGFYGVAFRFFAVGHVWLAFAVLAVFLATRVGARWLPSLAVLYGISLFSELAGTGYGVPFGEYSYSALLDPMWLGRVPVVIPLSWFFMSVPAYAVARRVLPARAQVASRIGLASLILLAWDLSLDPAMSYATRYWQWGSQGPYYGMPWLNLFGWYVTGLALMSALALLRADAWIRELPLGWLAGFYAVNLLLPLGMSAAAGLWGAVAATAVVLGGVGVLLRRLGLRLGAAPEPRPGAAAPADARLVGRA